MCYDLFIELHMVSYIGFSWGLDKRFLIGKKQIPLLRLQVKINIRKNFMEN